MIINSVCVRWFHAAAITICPFIFIAPDVAGKVRERILIHEWVHWWQQFVFGVIGMLIGIVLWITLSWPPQWEMFLIIGAGAIEGWVAAQLLWRALYLLCLPVGYNFFRRKWETAAYKAQGFGDNEIKEILKKAPYYLR